MATSPSSHKIDKPHTLTIDNSNRHRISTKFTVIKIVLLFGLFSIAYNLIKDIRNDTCTQNSIAGLTLGTIAVTGLLYFVSTRKRIDYDDIKQTLYVVDTKRHTEIEIPVEKIDKILFSSIGIGKGYYSYVIIYKDFHNQKQKVRLYTIPFDNSIDTIKMDAKLKNPNLVTRNWSVGLNEFFE